MRIFSLKKPLLTSSSVLVSASVFTVLAVMSTLPLTAQAQAPFQCIAYNLDGQPPVNDGEVCVENLSTTPNEFQDSGGGDVEVNWDITYSENLDPADTDTQCDIKTDPSVTPPLTGRELTEQTPHSVNITETTDFSIECEVAKNIPEAEKTQDPEPENFIYTPTSTVQVSTNSSPNASDDPVSMKECTDSVTIDVLNNDNDDDGDSLEIKSVESPSNGTAYEDNGKIVYTPDDNTDNSFSYTIQDGNGGEDTAQVDMSFSSCKGSISVQVEDQSGNPVNLDNIDITYDDGNCASDSDTSQLSCSPVLQDDGAIGTYSVSDPDYNIVDRRKETDAPDNFDGNPRKTELGF